MSIFWTVFLIAILIVPALWLAGIVWTIIVYLVIMIIGLIVMSFQWVIEKVKGE